MKQWTAGACALLMLVTAAFGQTDPSKPVLTINGETVSGAEYFRRMEVMPGVGRLVRGQFQTTYPGYLAMQQLINERLLLQVAREKGVFPRAEDIKKAMDERIKANPTLLESLGKFGVTRQDLEFQLTLDRAEFNLLTMGVNITDIEVEKFYRDNAVRYTLPRRYKLSVIAVAEANKEAVDKELAAGKKFADVAKALSQAPSAKDGGKMGDDFIPATALAEPTRVVLARTRIGAASDWIRGETGNWFKFFVTDAKAEELQKLDAALREEIRSGMMVDRGRVRNNIDRMMMEARRKANVQVLQTGFSDSIQEWLKTSTIE